MYRYISRESCLQFDSLPLTSLTIPPSARSSILLEATDGGKAWGAAAKRKVRSFASSKQKIIR